ncbi:MAG: hypothetical protein J0I54_20440 [Bosea sp.]|uniref:hypothetical protein n=1 Tax=unclassified Bosea (in: a-proteobacteria) TaxID=2653178 RepID=UPI000963C1A5|nr:MULTISPECIES: hypothetical protein [unclassified Bosea (in: a-proteobacteria)]MBN9459008.1 hypothetical protein [Bosea sp. (in: a-proteobacteria)]OJV06249.1 MAG: hypothetical protein BGO20_08305 [Bosea sp. 67-29]
MMTAGERFRPAWRDLRPGDPWTFITSDPIRMGIRGGMHAEAGSIIEWLPGDGLPLLFRVDEIAWSDIRRKRLAYSCTHIAQPPVFEGREP